MSDEEVPICDECMDGEDDCECPVEDVPEPVDDRVGMMKWNEAQYSSWVMIGISFIVSAFYWMQHYYFKFWYSTSDQYECKDVEMTKGWCINGYTTWAFAEWMNVFIMLLQQVPGMFVWILTISNNESLIWFFV